MASSPKPPKPVTPPPAAPPPPTIDEAAQNAEQSDRLRRRKGRVGLIFAGRRGANPGVAPGAVKQLTGN